MRKVLPLLLATVLLLPACSFSATSYETRTTAPDASTPETDQAPPCEHHLPLPEPVRVETVTLESNWTGEFQFPVELPAMVPAEPDGVTYRLYRWGDFGSGTATITNQTERDYLRSLTELTFAQEPTTLASLDHTAFHPYAVLCLQVTEGADTQTYGISPLNHRVFRYAGEPEDNWAQVFLSEVTADYWYLSALLAKYAGSRFSFANSTSAVAGEYCMCLTGLGYQKHLNEEEAALLIPLLEPGSYGGILEAYPEDPDNLEYLCITESYVDTSGARQTKRAFLVWELWLIWVNDTSTGWYTGSIADAVRFPAGTLWVSRDVPIFTYLP